ncbi:hypothetical protein ZWY2020_023853 [Hordeum vulgare]|nr:hypothetical protein ZWY2020_023853 [Hordeum vulgare]
MVPPAVTSAIPPPGFAFGTASTAMIAPGQKRKKKKTSVANGQNQLHHRDTSLVATAASQSVMAVAPQPNPPQVAPMLGMPQVQAAKKAKSRVGGLLHRVRFAAVCRSWRAAATHAAVPTVPWLIFHNGRDDKCNMRRVYCPEDDGFLRFRLPEALIGKSFVGSHDGSWVAALGHDKNLAIVNLFSGVEVPLHAKEMTTFYAYRKVIFSESPTTSRCILATITIRSSVALCRIACPAKRWTAKIFNGPQLMDIAFYNGKPYALTDVDDLIKFKIGTNKDGRPVVTVELPAYANS